MVKIWLYFVIDWMINKERYIMRSQRKEPSLFTTIPTRDYLGILKGSDPKKVVNYLQLTQEDVANATRVPKASVRYDKKIPEELAQRLQEIAVICELVAEYFNGDLEKTALWFRINNPQLGNISPRDMIRIGRYQKLIKFVQSALAGEAP